MGLLLGLLAFVFADTAQTMLRVWNTSNFEHSYLIPAISLWLLWREREQLAKVSVAPAWSGILPVAAVALAWLVGRLAGVNALEHLALVAMIPALVPLLFGWPMLRAAAFPLGFLFFAVPVGEFLQPKLMEWTADFTVAAIAFTGIPIVRDGLFFELPSGRWSVVEACSGLRYMLAAIPLACVYAYLSFASMRKRLLFILLSVAVALIGNWLRAYIIVMIGHLSGMTLAVGVDHLIYGWLFFGVIMGFTFWIGSRWEDTAPAPPPVAARVPAEGRPIARAANAVPALLVAAVCAALLLAATPWTARGLLARGAATVDMKALALGFSPAAPPGAYRPGFSGGIGKVVGRAGSDSPVGIEVIQFVRQHENGEMISHGNRTLPHAPGWRIVGRAPLDREHPGTSAPPWPVNEYEIAGPDGRYLVWEWYWLNGRALNDPRLVKLFTALDLMLGRGDESVAWFLWIPDARDRDAARAQMAAAAEQLSRLPPLAQLRNPQ